MDDLYIIVWNPLVHSIQGMWRGFAAPYWPPDLGGQMYRPLPVASFALGWTIAGAHPLLLHAINLCWHAVVAVAVAALTPRLAHTTAAFLAGLVFAVHPVYVEAIADVIGPCELTGAGRGLLAGYEIGRTSGRG